MKGSLLLGTIALLISALPAIAEGPPARLPGAGEEIVNPHWKEGLCGECHEGRPEKGKPLAFRYSDFNRLCNRCHEKISSHAYIHATGMVPSEEKLAYMKRDFKEALYRGDREGRLTCIVCHNLVYQCLREEYKRRLRNPLFLRGGPYRYRTSICYKCHDIRRYTRLDPHDQITDEGEILTSKCNVCHIGTPDVKTVRGIQDVKFKVEKDLTRLCRRCHNDMPKHPGTFVAGLIFPTKKGEEFTHLRVPSEKVLQRLERTTKEKGIIMPLEPGTGRIFCATCHNPHERGIQRLIQADRGADNEQRLRTLKRSDLCLMCHDK